MFTLLRTWLMLSLMYNKDGEFHLLYTTVVLCCQMMDRFLFPPHPFRLVSSRTHCMTQQRIGHTIQKNAHSHLPTSREVLWNMIYCNRNQSFSSKSQWKTQIIKPSKGLNNSNLKKLGDFISKTRTLGMLFYKSHIQIGSSQQLQTFIMDVWERLKVSHEHTLGL